MKRNLHIFLWTWLLLMAAVPIYNVVTQGATTTAQIVMSKGRLSKSALQKAIFNLDKPWEFFSQIGQPFGISIDPKGAIIGRDGWLYLGDRYEATLTAMREGLTPKDEAQAHAISEAMLKWNGWLSQRGVRSFRIMIGPDKPSIHPEGLPDWAMVRRPAKIQSLTTGSARTLYVDLTDGLRQLATQTTEPLYFKTDTHWNALGAAHALSLFAAALKGNDLGLRWPTDGELRLVRVDSRLGGDLANFLRMADSLPDQEPVIDLPLTGKLDTQVVDFDTNKLLRNGDNIAVNFPFQTVLVSSPKALNQRRVLWVRDSFGAALSPYMAATFSDVVQLHYDRAFEDGGQRLAQIVDQWRPDLVFMTVVERAALSECFATSPPFQRWGNEDRRPLHNTLAKPIGRR